jgi:hypothetical protein
MAHPASIFLDECIGDDALIDIAEDENSVYED